MTETNIKPQFDANKLLEQLDSVPTLDDAKLESFYERRLAAKAGAAAPVALKALSRDRPLLRVMVTNIRSGGKTEKDKYCNMSFVVVSATGNYTQSVDVKNFKNVKVASVDKEHDTVTIFTNVMDTHATAVEYWAKVNVERAKQNLPPIVLKKQNDIGNTQVISTGTQMTMKVDKDVMAGAINLAPFTIINIGVSSTRYCTTEEQSKERANVEPMEGVSNVIKQFEVVESAKPQKVIDYIVETQQCQVPMLTARQLAAAEDYHHVPFDGDKKPRISTSSLCYIPINCSPAKFFGLRKALLVELSFKYEELKSPFAYKDKDKVFHQRTEGLLAIEEVDPLNPTWVGNKHVCSFVMFKDLCTFARIVNVNRWKDLAPMFFAQMRMILVAAVDLYATFENPRTKDNVRDETWSDNYLELQPRQLVIDFPSEVARLGMPLSRRWIEAQLTLNRLMTSDPENQLRGPDKAVLNLSEWDGPAALEFVRRPSSSGYRFFLISDTAPNESVLDKYDAIRKMMDLNPDTPGLEMLLNTYFSEKHAKRWSNEIYGSPDAVVIPPSHPCFAMTAGVPKSYVIYAVDVAEIAKRGADAKANPLKKILGTIAAAVQSSNSTNSSNAIAGPLGQKMLEGGPNPPQNPPLDKAESPKRKRDVSENEDGELSDDDSINQTLKNNKTE